MPQGAPSYVRRFYYDTALSTSPIGLASLKALVDPSHILFGSDCSFAPAPVVTSQTNALFRMQLWSEAEKQGINRDHALRLFPRFRLTGEEVMARAAYQHASWQVRLRNIMTKPLLIAGDNMRNR